MHSHINSWYFIIYFICFLYNALETTIFCPLGVSPTGHVEPCRDTWWHLPWNIRLDPSRIFQLSEFVWTMRSSVWVVFNHFLLIDATDRSKTGSDQDRIKFDISLYPFHFSRTLPLTFDVYSAGLVTIWKDKTWYVNVSFDETEYEMADRVWNSNLKFFCFISLDALQKINCFHNFILYLFCAFWI